MPDSAEPTEMDVSGNMSESENEYDDLEGNIKDEDDKMTEQNAASDGVDVNGEPKKKYDPKDPLRPRRKKARRACFACQRAHLTCGKSYGLLFPQLMVGSVYTGTLRCWRVPVLTILR